MEQKTIDFLEHFGVKGMKWGVRRAERQAARADKKWQKNIYSTAGAVAVHNATATRVNAALPAFNKKYRDTDPFDMSSPKTQKYHQDYSDLVVKATSEAVREVHGSSPSGKLTATLMSGQTPLRIVVVESEVKHADIEKVNVEMEIETDENGMFVGVSYVDAQIKQSDPVEDFLEHFGVKGMKWGVRKSAPKKGSAAQQKRSAKDNREKVKRKNAAKNRRVLSDQDLDRYISRMEKEKKLKTLVDDDVNPGQKFVKAATSQTGRQVIGTVGAGLGVYAVRAAIQGKWDNKEAVDYLKPKKK